MVLHVYYEVYMYMIWLKVAAWELYHPHGRARVCWVGSALRAYILHSLSQRQVGEEIDF